MLLAFLVALRLRTYRHAVEIIKGGGVTVRTAIRDGLNNPCKEVRGLNPAQLFRFHRIEIVRTTR